MKKMFTLVLLSVSLNLLFSQSTYVIYNSASGNGRIRDVNCVSGSTILDEQLYPGKLVSTSTSNNCSNDWYYVDIPGNSTSRQGYIASGTGLYLQDPSTSYVTITGVGTGVGLYVRPTAGATGTSYVDFQLDALASQVMKVYDNQKFALYSNTPTSTGGYNWYQIWITACTNCSPACTGWVRGDYVVVTNPSPQYGSITTTITPNTIGAQWQVNGTGTWYNSGATASNVPVGSNYVNFSPVAGWTSPANYNVTVSNGQTATASGTYTQIAQYGSITTTITPNTIGAQWQVNGTGSWYSSGATAANVPVGSNYVNFSSVAGWTAPGNDNITVSNGQTAIASGTYTQIAQYGSITTTILPNTIGAQWQVNGTGTWYSSGASASNVPVGSNYVNFSNVAGWTAPGNDNITVSNGQTATASGTYTQITEYGSITTTIVPNTIGAKWQVNGAGTWYSSGATASNVPVGSNYVNFSSVAGWTAPTNQNVTVTNGQTANASGTYTQIVNTSILINSPNGGENWLVGTSQIISGTCSNNITSIQLEYTTDNGISFLPISSVSPTTGSFVFSWIVPATPSRYCKIRATGNYSGGTLTDLSDAVFTISLNCFAVDHCNDYMSNIECLADYPYTDPQDSHCVLDSNNTCGTSDAWGFCRYNCTSWVAWAINRATGHTDTTGYHPFTNGMVNNHNTSLGDAVNWKAALQALGDSVDKNAAVGAIAWWGDHYGDSSGIGHLGHVAYVSCISGTYVTLTEFNFHPACYYDDRVVNMASPYKAGNRIPDFYIHVEQGGLGSGTAVNNIAGESRIFNLYPNPSNGRFSVSLRDLGNDLNYELVVLNLIGERVFNRSINPAESNIELNLESLSTGLYLVQVTDGKSSSVQRIIINH